MDGAPVKTKGERQWGVGTRKEGVVQWQNASHDIQGNFDFVLWKKLKIHTLNLGFIDSFRSAVDTRKLDATFCLCTFFFAKWTISFKIPREVHGYYFLPGT